MILLHRLTFVRNFLSRKSVLKPHVPFANGSVTNYVEFALGFGSLLKPGLGTHNNCREPGFLLCSYLRDVPSETRTYVSSYHKPFLRKGLIGRLVHCTSKTISQEEGCSLASEPSWFKSLETWPCPGFLGSIRFMASLFMGLPGYYTSFLFRKFLLFLNFSSDKMPPPIKHRSHIFMD